MSEEALQIIWQAKLLLEGINDSFGAKISEDIIDKMVSELQIFDEVGQSNRMACYEVVERLQQSEDLTESITETWETRTATLSQQRKDFTENITISGIIYAEEFSNFKKEIEEISNARIKIQTC